MRLFCVRIGPIDAFVAMTLVLSHRVVSFGTGDFMPSLIKRSRGQTEDGGWGGGSL